MKALSLTLAVAFLVGCGPSDGLQEGMQCDYLGTQVQILDSFPMGTGVTGAILISPGPDGYDRIVPRTDLQSCEEPEPP